MDIKKTNLLIFIYLTDCVLPKHSSISHFLLLTVSSTQKLIFYLHLFEAFPQSLDIHSVPAVSSPPLPPPRCRSQRGHHRRGGGRAAVRHRRGQRRRLDASAQERGGGGIRSHILRRGLFGNERQRCNDVYLTPLVGFLRFHFLVFRERRKTRTCPFAPPDFPRRQITIACSSEQNSTK